MGPDLWGKIESTNSSYQEQKLQHTWGLVQAYIHNLHFLASSRRNIVKHIPTLFPVNKSLSKLYTQVPYIKTELRHDSFIPHTSQYSESLFCCKTGQVLQTSSHNQFLSCVLSKRASNTYQSIHLRYPDHPLQAVTPLTHFSIFISKLCRLSYTARFKLFQSKPSIGDASLDLRQAHRSSNTIKGCYIALFDSNWNKFFITFDLSI